MLTRRKRLLFQSIVLVAVYGLVELASLIYLKFSGLDSPGRLHATAQLDPMLPAGREGFPMMIHPYIGMVHKPNQDSVRRPPGLDRVNEYGFIDSQPPVRKRGPDRVIVGLMGGSVARQMGISSTNILERELSRLSPFQGRSFEFVRLAIDGNKQPQQLMTLNYLLTMGGEFDLLINLDGLNEIALPEMDNVPFGTAAIYPRKWGTLSTVSTNLELTRMIGYLTYLRVVQRDAARWLDSSALRYSPTAVLIWRVRNSRLEQQILEQITQVNLHRAQEMAYGASGPTEKFDTEEQLLAHCADIWARSSILLHQLCTANQIRYFHFLQPNQYLTGSKPIGDEEKSVAINIDSPFRQPVQHGFPLLQTRGEQLRAAGVAFSDLTRIFADHPEQIYRDDCCHVTEAGDQILAATIAARITESYKADTVPTLQSR